MKAGTPIGLVMTSVVATGGIKLILVTGLGKIAEASFLWFISETGIELLRLKPVVETEFIEVMVTRGGSGGVFTNTKEVIGLDTSEVEFLSFSICRVPSIASRILLATSSPVECKV